MNGTDFLTEEDKNRIQEIKKKIKETNDPLLIEELQEEAISLINKAMEKFNEYINQHSKK